MADIRTITSPKENVAEKPVVLIQDAQSKIKEIIVESYYKGLTKEEIEAALRKVIWETGEQLPERMRDSVKQALAQNAQKWHYLYTQSIRATNASLLRAIEGLQASSQKINFAVKTYNISLQDHLGSPANEQKVIIDKFRPYLTEDRLGSQVIEKYESNVKSHLKTLARDPAYFQRIDKNGKPYKPNLRNFAEMTARYEANLEDVKRLRDSDVKLVWTSSHMDASDRCAPYQGRLYALDGSSGTIDGTPYTPLDDALLGPRGDGNGIINGYNCRHRLIEYTPRSKAPREYDRATIRRENAINNRQRLYERDIRNLKIEQRLALQAGYKEEASELEKQWQKLNSHYQSFSLKNERAYYPWRTRVTQEEVDRQG